MLHAEVVQENVRPLKAQALPGIVVAGVQAHGVAVALQPFVEIFIGKVLMTG